MRLYVTNFSSRSLRGPGMVYSIMAAPRPFERGDGSVSALVPRLEDLRRVRDRLLTTPQYLAAYEAHIRMATGGDLSRFLGPRRLRARTGRGPADRMVTEGDTICCACAKDAAAAGECHRVRAANLLRIAGWDVWLDGEELIGLSCDGVPVTQPRQGRLL